MNTTQTQSFASSEMGNLLQMTNQVLTNIAQQLKETN